MGYAEYTVTMDSRTGSVSSGLGSSCGARGQALQSSPFCPRSSSKLTQSIIKDHMVSHYKKVYSAKAAVDNSVPKSMLQSVKYNDQIRQERLRKSGRPQSAQSFLQRSSRTSCSSIQRSSGQFDESPYFYSRNSIVSSPRVTTSFNPKDIVYPSCQISSHYPRPASEMNYVSSEAALQRKQSVCSLAALRDQGYYKAFQDPVQKTYGGDLLQKHAQHFTQDKPFTPKTLKSDKSSYLSKYRYYRAPRRKPTQDCSTSVLMRQKTYHGSTQHKDNTQELYQPSQEDSTEHVWSDDEVNSTSLSSSRQQSQTTKRKKHFYGSSFRVFQEGRKSPIMRHVSAEEEELLYLEFISAVTEDILSRGHVSERVINQVMKRHIDMNLHQLEESKMRHLLEVLRKEFEEPNNTSTSDKQLEKKENNFLDTIFSHLQSEERRVKTKEDNDSFSYASLVNSNFPDYPDPLLVSTPVWSPEGTSFSINKKDEENDNEKEGMDFPLLAGNVINNADDSQGGFHHEGTNATNDVYNGEHKHTTTKSDVDNDQAGINFDEQSKDVEDLGRDLSELLHVSSNTDSDNQEAAPKQHTNTVSSASDDEF